MLWVVGGFVGMVVSAWLGYRLLTALERDEIAAKLREYL
jgi:hypothetical protein